MKESFAIGADIGGSHISAAVMQLSDGKLLKNTRFDLTLDNKASANEITTKWGTAIKNAVKLAGDKNINGIGIAMPGPFDYVNGISLFNGETKKYENTYGLNVSKALRDFLHLSGTFPIRFINDAAAFAIGEEWTGKAKGTHRSICITLGTGLGSGFIEKGLPVFNLEDVPENGFIYHLPYKNGIADDFFSTRGLIKAYKEIKGKQASNVKEIANAANTDREALELMEYFGDQLAQLLIPWLAKFEAEVLVVGGNISKAFHLFGKSLQKRINNSGLNIKVEKSELNDAAQIIGAAKIINEDYWQIVSPRLNN